MKEMLGDRMEQKGIANGRTAVVPCTLTTSEYGEHVNMESVTKVNALTDSSMSSHTLSSTTASEEKAAVDKSDETMKDLIELRGDDDVHTSAAHNFSGDLLTGFSAPTVMNQCSMRTTSIV